MAIDTRSKRSSAINLASPWRSQWPAPDGTINAGDRAQIAFMYSGFGNVGTAGYRSFLAYWMGGASSPGGASSTGNNDIVLQVFYHHGAPHCAFGQVG